MIVNWSLQNLMIDVSNTPVRMCKVGCFARGLLWLQALNRDVAEVNELLPEQDRLELLDMVQSNSSRQNKREV